MKRLRIIATSFNVSPGLSAVSPESAIHREALMNKYTVVVDVLAEDRK